jgi:hypothetical protein
MRSFSLNPGFLIGAVLAWSVTAAHAQSTQVARATSSRAEATRAFRELLSPYGMWVSLAPYGEVWVPREAARPDFAPYATGGRWVDGARGLVFDSMFPWGAVCLHHGRWVRLSELGAWAWVPDTTWASSWVEWRVGQELAAWRPMGPTGEPRDGPWILARLEDLGASDLAARARLVDEDDVTSLAPGLPRVLAPAEAEPAEAEAEAEPAEAEREAVLDSDRSGRTRATAGPGEVMISGGGRLVVHERGGDRVIEVPPVIVRRDSPEAREAEARRRASIERQTEREREAAERTQAILARADAREREAREARASRAPTTTAPPTATTTVVAQPIFGFPFGGMLGSGPPPAAWGSVGFPATPRRPTDAVTPGAPSPRFDARLPFGTWRD